MGVGVEVLVGVGVKVGVDVEVFVAVEVKVAVFVGVGVYVFVGVGVGVRRRSPRLFWLARIQKTINKISKMRRMIRLRFFFMVFLVAGNRCGLKPCLSSWKPLRGLHVLSRWL